MEHIKLLEALDYDVETGIFTWKKTRPLSHFKNESAMKMYIGRFAGKRAGHTYHMKNSDVTYIQIRVFTKLYLGHRLAWFYVNGEWPENLIDHKDGNGTNNIFSNLRQADKILNGRNCSLSRNNTSGINGVYWNKQNQNWVAEGHYTGDGVHKKKSLGSYARLEDAARARGMWQDSQGNFTGRHGTQ